MFYFSLALRGRLGVEVERVLGVSGRPVGADNLVSLVPAESLREFGYDFRPE
jgi:hypothetical protein